MKKRTTFKNFINFLKHKKAVAKGDLLYCLYLYPGFYSYTEGATWKILDLLTETLLI